MARKKKTTTEEHDVLLVTQSGYDDMVGELNHRMNTLRDEIASEINEARNLGDLSENQAYSEAMERKNMNEGRIEELEQLISIAQIIQKSDSNTVGVGNTLDIKNLKTSSVRTITLVGKGISQEADPRQGKISIDSPLGHALNGSKKGDVVKVDLPSGLVEYQIVSIAA